MLLGGCPGGATVLAVASWRPRSSRGGGAVKGRSAAESRTIRVVSAAALARSPDRLTTLDGARAPAAHQHRRQPARRARHPGSGRGICGDEHVRSAAWCGAKHGLGRGVWVPSGSDHRRPSPKVVAGTFRLGLVEAGPGRPCVPVASPDQPAGASAGPGTPQARQQVGVCERSGASQEHRNVMVALDRKPGAGRQGLMPSTGTQVRPSDGCASGELECSIAVSSGALVGGGGVAGIQSARSRLRAGFGEARQ
jgi:hypothetical protein